MAWIRTIGDQEAEGALADLYDGVRDARSGSVDNIMLVHSLHPAGLKAHAAVYRAAMGGTRGLSYADREMVALVVSRINGCHY